MVRKTQARLRLVAIDGLIVSRGYKSGLKSLRETPESFSSKSTRPGGTPARRHLSIACGDMPTDLASSPSPHALIALSTAGLSSMGGSQPQVECGINLRSVAGLNPGFHPLRMSPLGKIITRELSRLGQTQSWLAEKVGVSENAVSKWILTGKISRENAKSASTHLGISIDQLLNQDSAAEHELDAEWRRLSPSLKAKLISMVHEIREIPAVESPARPTKKPATASRR